MKAQLNKKKSNGKRPAKVAKRGKAVGPRMGPVSTITTAPVAIGNSVRGSSTMVSNTPDGVIVGGRDFCFTAAPTAAAITNWCTVGGTPLTPAAFSDSSIRQYMQLYQRFRWRAITVHYITSSPTSANGDVVFYYGKNRDSVYLSQTSPNFLPFVISDSNTVLGPQWANHSATLHVVSDWKSTDYGMHSGLCDYAAGEVFLLSKTSTTESPGYVLMDYVIEFAEMQISPRLLSLPISRIQYTNLGFTVPITTAGTALQGNFTGTNLGGAASVYTQILVGDIYKCILDITNSSLALPNIATDVGGAGDVAVVTPVDGTTIYAVYNGTTMLFYPTVESAYTAGANFLAFKVANVAAINLQTWCSFVGSTGSININPNF